MKIPKKSKIKTLNNPSKSLADFFNGIVIECEKEYEYIN